MIKFYCDICEQERSEEEILGVSSFAADHIMLTDKESYQGVANCKKHICWYCLAKLNHNEKKGE